MCCGVLVHGWGVMYAGGWRLCSMHRVLLCMLEAVDDGLCLLEVLEVKRSVLLCMLEVPEVMRCVLLCMLDAVEGGFRLVEVLEVPEAMRCVLLCMPDAVEGRL